MPRIVERNVYLLFFLLTLTLRVAPEASNAIMAQVNIQFDTSLTPDSYYYPHTVLIQVRLNGPRPIRNARVTAEVKAPSLSVQKILFQETGGTIPHDARYSAVVTSILEDGLYIVNLFADDNQGRAVFASGLESEPRPGQIRAASPAFLPPFEVGHIFRFTAYGYGSDKDFRPLRVTDLYIEPTLEGCFRLAWTAPLGLKAGSRYEVRASREALSSEKVWQEAEFLTSAEYSVKGGDKQTEKVCLSINGMFYLAVRSFSKGGLESGISNDFVIVITN